MSGYRIPGSLGVSTCEAIDDGTMCRCKSPLPGVLGIGGGAGRPVSEAYLYSPAVRATIEVPFSIAPGMTWDSFWRLFYDRTAEGLQRQANTLLTQGHISAAESRALVEARNALLLRVRSRLSPFGQLYSELLKPRSSLKGFQAFLSEKGSIEAVLKSVGKTRAVVNRIGVVSRVLGPASIVLEVSLTAVVIQQADPAERDRVTARELGGLAGSVGGGLGGMWAGCASAALLVSPSLTLPVVGEVTTGGACLVGGLLGGLGFGWLGRSAGEGAGAALYDIVNEVSEFRWLGGK